MMKDEGLDKIFKRHEKHKLALSAAVKTLNLKLFAHENHLSPAVTAIQIDDIDAEKFRKIIKNKYDILLAGGQDHLKGKIFRVGHLGYINDRDIIAVIAAIGNTLVEQNIIAPNKAGEALKIASLHLSTK